MANGIGLIEGVLLLAMGVPNEPGRVEPGRGDPELLVKLSSAMGTDSCLVDARSFSGTVSPARHLDSSVSYLPGGKERNFVLVVDYNHFNSFIQRDEVFDLLESL